MVDFAALIGTLKDVGFYSILLPFILTFAVIYAVLEKSNILKGKDEGSLSSRNLNIIVSLIFGFFVVASIQAVTYIQTFIIGTIVVLLFLVCIFIVLGMLFGDDLKNLFFLEDGKIRKNVRYTMLGIIILVVLVFLATVFWEPLQEILTKIERSDFVSVITIVVVVGIIYLVTRDKKSEKPEEGGKDNEKKKEE